MAPLTPYAEVEGGSGRFFFSPDEEANVGGRASVMSQESRFNHDSPDFNHDVRWEFLDDDMWDRDSLEMKA